MNYGLKKSPGNCPEQSQNTHTPASKKTSPLKHVPPIIKKYDCQRQAKNGKSVKLKSQTNKLDEDPRPLNNLPVMVAGMDSLDAALRRAEKCIAGSKDHQDNAVEPSENYGSLMVEHGFHASADEVLDGEDEDISSKTALDQYNPVTNQSLNPRAQNRVLKKHNQLQKDLDHALPLAMSDQPSMNGERCLGFAASFFIKVKERYEASNHDVFGQFLQILEDYIKGCERPAEDCDKGFYSPTDLYHRVISLFVDSPDLCEEFLLTLLPTQAFKCAKFMEHLALSEMLLFIQKLELFFEKQPQQLRKILAALAHLAATPNLPLETVRRTILPLLRGNSFLVDSFLELLPSERPSESKMTDFDLVLWEDMDREHSGEKKPFERLEIPPGNDHQYGGEKCQCCCHSTSANPAIVNRIKHCTACGIKFISGKVFMQTESGLRPARILFSGNGSTSNNIKRLNANHQKLSRPRSRHGRVSTPQVLLKIEECKQNVKADDEALLASKIKSPRQRPKISKPKREKPSSVKCLSLNYTSCSHKPAEASVNFPSMSVLDNQEAMMVPVRSSNAEQKPSGLHFSDLSSTENENEKKDLSVDEVVWIGDETKENIELGCQDAIKEECRMEVDPVQIAGLKTANSESMDTEIIKGSENEVKAEDNASDDVTVNLEDRRTEDNADDNDGESNIDVSGASSECDAVESSDKKESLPWTRDEDRIILCTFQSEPVKEKTLSKISAQLPHRTVDEISSRFQLLMDVIKKLR